MHFSPQCQRMKIHIKFFETNTNTLESYISINYITCMQNVTVTVVVVVVAIHKY